jgi:hypothetical protein
MARIEAAWPALGEGLNDIHAPTTAASGDARAAGTGRDAANRYAHNTAAGCRSQRGSLGPAAAECHLR